MPKLVRDKIPEIIKHNAQKSKTHIANDTEYWQKLKEKLREECDEFIEAENEEELADILEVIDAIIKCKKFKSVEKIKLKKFKERGGFQKRIILEKVE